MTREGDTRDRKGPFKPSTSLVNAVAYTLQNISVQSMQGYFSMTGTANFIMASIWKNTTKFI